MCRAAAGGGGVFYGTAELSWIWEPSAGTCPPHIGLTMQETLAVVLRLPAIHVVVTLLSGGRERLLISEPCMVTVLVGRRRSTPKAKSWANHSRATPASRGRYFGRRVRS